MAISNRAAFAAACLLMLPALPAAAQTAGDINRLNQAVQICNSPMGAGMAECARLRGQLGGGYGGGTATKAAGIASLLGGAMGGANAAPAPAAAPTVGIDLNRAITACVARAAGDQAQIERCLAIASGGVPARP